MNKISITITRFTYQLLLLVLVCWGAHAWFTWEWDFMALGRFRILFAFLAISILYIASNNIKMSFSGTEICIFILWCLASLPPEFKLVSPIIEALRFFPLLVLFKDKRNIDSHLRFVSIGLAIILIPGIILWSLIQTGYYTLPGIPIQMGESSNDNYYFYNYFFLIDRILVTSTRFQSIFLEPGYLGSMLALLLYATKYNWKCWYNWVLLVGLILSQSLAGYATFVIGYIIYLSQNGKSVKTLVIPVAVISMFVYAMQYYNDGDNYINKNIAQRLTDSNDDKYVFSGTIRSDNYTDRVYSESIESGDFIFGESRELNISGAGYKIFLIKNGLFAAILYFIVYNLISKFSKNRKYGRYFVLLILLTFLQAAYPFSYSWMIQFILGIFTEKSNKTKQIFIRNENLVH